MAIRNSAQLLTLGWTLAGLVTAVLLALIQSGFAVEIAPILLFVSGALVFFLVWTTGAVIGQWLLSRQLNRSASKTTVVELHFDERAVRQNLKKGREDLAIDVTDAEYRVLDSNESPWKLTAADLLGQDKALALAKLRMDLEQELRLIAAQHDINPRSRPIGALGLAQELVDDGVLPRSWLGALKDVVAVANQAIHGRDVSDEAAASVVRIGDDLLESLRLVSKQELVSESRRATSH